MERWMDEWVCGCVSAWIGVGGLVRVWAASWVCGWVGLYMGWWSGSVWVVIWVDACGVDWWVHASMQTWVIQFLYQFNCLLLVF